MRQSKLVSAEEMAAQKNFIQQIHMFYCQQGKKPSAFVETYGCQQNASDSERLMGMLEEMGFSFCSEPDEADLVLYNTCAVRENAELRVFGNIGALKHVKRRRPEMVIGVCGCMMQQAHIAETIRKKYTHVDLVFGTHALYRFPELLWSVLQHQRIFEIADEEGRIAEGITSRRDMPPLARIPIIYGCNNFCTYCIVPYVRGRERSRKIQDILADVCDVAAKGYREVMLLGQNVNSYGNDLEEEIDFASLMRQVCRVEGIERVRFMTSHPKDLSDALIDTMAEEPKICKQLHLPVQSGSDRILRAMNRKYTVAEYLELVDKVRAKMPDIVLTTDIIVGFPGETNEDFEQTLAILKKVQYDTIFSFIYSKRVGTPAAQMPDVMTEEEKHRNFEKMLQVQNEISRRKNDAYHGKVVTVLVEGASKNNSENLTGRTEGGKVVNFPGNASLVGKFVRVRITQSQTWSLFGEIESEEA
ncbi:tRNA (N6-isopentenyl adenosine(37)-C2)-methylthiotransferase MiaB [Ructibacterium gallinarum]|uniref:tRNA-2-methylthio-N(6)-dimethylallyladenosine synthase n=1 Tax=Ructibacterium gallinarum TaxID=2779355 RepID=A0A9D5M0M9_9FIRM|nr:tRNA (N6-isopentenyl adenosine(37)-C2)-methylthiotransferase MiaB [Ructibacterium gallinarum]MBE5040095.1 tRNA (N6-isopentenyl adenosine(37)-C2)-methylthiotransferase MiaB [Ructibacterium gallinarum]